MASESGWRRRHVIAGMGVLGAGVLLPGHMRADDVLYDEANLLPGEFTWYPERSPAGPLAIVVSLPEQRVHVYRNGIRIAVSTCSTGKPGHLTPTGVFTILQKDRHHHSSTYNNAPMPNMNRLTWDGIALHAGNLPGYPASHGCVRLPMAFSEKLFTLTLLGTPVIIAGAASDPWALTHPGLILGSAADREMRAAVDGLAAKAQPSDWSAGKEYPLVSVLATGADRRVALIVDGDEILEDVLGIDGDGPLGEHVLVLREAADGNLVWSGITYHPDGGTLGDPDRAVVPRLQATPSFRAEATARMHPGMLMIVSDLASHPDRQTGADFVLMASDVVAVPPPPLRPAERVERVVPG